MSVTTMPKPRLKTRLRTEIRERQHAEAALRQSEERYRIISQAISDYAFAFHFTPDGELIVDWLTDSFTKITGYPVPEVLGNPRALRTYIHPEDQERVMTTLRTLPPGQPTSYQFRLVTKQGQGPLASVLSLGSSGRNWTRHACLWRRPGHHRAETGGRSLKFPVSVRGQPAPDVGL